MGDESSFLYCIFYGLTAPVGLILHISNSKKIMEKYTNGILSDVGGILSLFMSLAVFLLFIVLFNQ